MPQYWPRSEWTIRLGVGGCAKKARCKAVVTNSSGIVAAYDVLGAHVLKGAQVRPVAIGQGQIREVALRWSAKSGQNRVVP